jgi:hypothetical protein
MEHVHGIICETKISFVEEMFFYKALEGEKKVLHVSVQPPFAQFGRGRYCRYVQGLRASIFASVVNTS